MALVQLPPVHLYRSMLRVSKQVNDYNFRSYAIRRVKTGWRLNRNLIGEEAVAALRKGRENLELLKRQSIIGNLYPSAKSVME